MRPAITMTLSTTTTFIYFLLMTTPPPRSTLFPYTTLFRSHASGRRRLCRHHHAGRRPRSPRRLPWRHTGVARRRSARSEEHTSELQSRRELVCRLLLEKKKN